MLPPIASLTSLLESGKLPKPVHIHSFSPGAGIGTSEHLDNHHQRTNSFEIFNAILEKAYQKMAFSTDIDTSSPASQFDISDYETVEKISSEQAANTILNFISQKLQSDQADGADEQMLLDRLEQGLEGFINGFNEAKNQIEAMGLLTPDLLEEINDTYARVIDGIAQLKEDITGEAAPDRELATAEAGSFALAASTSQNSSFSLQLTTQDGDKVTIDISKTDQSSFSSSATADNNGISLTASQQTLSASSFSMNVVGELDASELDAINNLLVDVTAIADDFFEGDYDKAFALALELDINKDELAGLNLQLQKTTVTQAMEAYTTTSQIESSSPTNQTSAFADLNQLLDDLQNILDQLRKFPEPLDLLEQLSTGISQLANGPADQPTNNNLFGMLNSLISQFKL